MKINPESTSLIGSGVLLSWSNIPDENADDWNNWYTFQHLPERVSIPGFLRARRFIEHPGTASQTTPYGRYLTLYEVAEVDTLKSERYFHHLNEPTEWSVLQQSRPRTSGASGLMRTVCSVSYSAGLASGGSVFLYLLPEMNDDARGQLYAYIDQLVAGYDAIAGHVFKSNLEVTTAKAVTKEGRGSSAKPIDGEMLFVELSLMDRLGDVLAKFPKALLPEGAEQPTVAAYSLIVSHLSGQFRP